MTHWLAAKKYLPGNLIGEEAKEQAHQSQQGGSNAGGGHAGGGEGGSRGSGESGHAAGNSNGNMTSYGSSPAFSGMGAGGPNPRGSPQGAGQGRGNGQNYNPAGQPGAMFSPGGSGGGGAAGPGRNVLLDKITSLESQQLTLISQLMGQKEEISRFAATRVNLEKELLATQKARETMETQAQQSENDRQLARSELQSERSRFATEFHNERTRFATDLQNERTRYDALNQDLAGCRAAGAACEEQRVKLATERVWFEKRFVQAQESMNQANDSITLLTTERGQLQRNLEQHKKDHERAVKEAVDRWEKEHATTRALQPQVAELMRQMELMRLAHEAAMQKLRDEHEVILLRTRREHDATVARMARDFETQCNSLRSEHEVFCSRVQADHAALLKRMGADLGAARQESEEVQLELHKALEASTEQLHMIEEMKKGRDGLIARQHETQTSYNKVRNDAVALKNHVDRLDAQMKADSEEHEQLMRKTLQEHGIALAAKIKAHENDLTMTVEEHHLLVSTTVDELTLTLKNKEEAHRREIEEKDTEHERIVREQIEDHEYQIQVKDETHDRTIREKDEDHERITQDLAERHERVTQDTAERHERVMRDNADRYERVTRENAERHENVRSHLQGTLDQQAAKIIEQNSKINTQTALIDQLTADLHDATTSLEKTRVELTRSENELALHRSHNEDLQEQLLNASVFVPGVGVKSGPQMDSVGGSSYAPPRRGMPQQEREGPSSGAPMRRGPMQDREAQSSGAPMRRGPSEDREGPSSGAPMRRGPMQDKQGVSAGNGSLQDDAAEAEAAEHEAAQAEADAAAAHTQGNGTEDYDDDDPNSFASAVRQFTGPSQNDAYAKKCREYAVLRKQFAELGAAHQALVLQSSLSAGLRIERESDSCIPANLHGLSQRELVTVVLSMKQAVLGLQDTNDALASRAFLAQHTISRLEHSSVRTSELQRHILQQEQVFSVRYASVARDLVLAQAEREDVLRRLMSESTDVVLRGMVQRTETEIKHLARQNQERAEELEAMQRAFREMEAFQSQREQEAAQQFHEAQAAWHAQLEQQRNVAAEAERSLALRAEQVFVSGSTDATLLRQETEKVFESRLDQQRHFWQEKEATWIQERALMLSEWQREEASWSREKDAFERVRHNLAEARKALDAENTNIWTLKLAEKDEAWARKFEALAAKQADADRIIKGMELQWKRRVEEWKDKESVLLAAASQGMMNQADPTTARTNLLTEAEKERHLALANEWSQRERQFVEQLAAAKLAEQAWRKEKQAMRNQMDLLGQDLQDNLKMQGGKTLNGQEERGSNAGAPTPDAKPHFAGSSAFALPGSSTQPQAGGYNTLQPLVEQDYQRRIDQLQQMVDVLTADSITNAAALASVNESKRGSESTANANARLESSLTAASGGAMALMQKRLDEKAQEVYALTRRAARLEEELASFHRKAALNNATVSTQSAQDASVHAQRVEAIQAKYEHEIQQLLLDHQAKLHNLHAEYTEQAARSQASTKQQQAEYMRHLAEIQDSHAKHLQAREREAEREKDAHHVHLKAIQVERLEEIQRHNAQVLQYQKDKNEAQRASDVRREEMRLLETQLATQEESIRILEAQVENEREKTVLAGATKTPTSLPPLESSASLLAWQREKRQLLEHSLQSEHAHADELEKLTQKVVAVEAELDHEREKNKILYTQIQILSERNAKHARRNVLTSPSGRSTTRGIDHEHQQLLDEMDPRGRGLGSSNGGGMALSPRAGQVSFGSPSHSGYIPASSGQGLGGGPTTRELASASASIAELEASHLRMQQSWSKEKQLLESHIAHLQRELEATVGDKGLLQSEATRLRNEYVLLETAAGKYQKKVDVLQQHLDEHGQSKLQLAAALTHLQGQYNALSATVQQRNSLEIKRNVELERNLQAAQLDLKRMEMEKLTLHRCVATLTEKCSKMQQEKDSGASFSASSESPSELLKMLSSQITSLTSTVEKQQLRVRLLQSAVDKLKADGEEGHLALRAAEQSLLTTNQLIAGAQERALLAENRYHTASQQAKTIFGGNDGTSANKDALAAASAISPSRR